LTGVSDSPYNPAPRRGELRDALVAQIKYRFREIGNGIVRGNALFDIVYIGRDAQAAARRFIPSTVDTKCASG
jgi:hypothetical protein